ncbi:MAG: phosphopantetheine-binding protein [Opitutaceae bacterium]|jgi:acyl carrier protein
MPDPLIIKLKRLIIDTLKIEDVGPDDIRDDAPLVDCGIQFDSIDSLELAVQLEKEFGLRVNSNEGAKITYGSVSDLARFLRERVPAEKLAC